MACALPFDHLNFALPSPEIVDSMIRAVGWSEREVAKIVGLNYDLAKGCAPIRHWRGVAHIAEYQQIPYSVWRLLLLTAGLVTQPPQLKRSKRRENCSFCLKPEYDVVLASQSCSICGQCIGLFLDKFETVIKYKESFKFSAATQFCKFCNNLPKAPLSNVFINYGSFALCVECLFSTRLVISKDNDTSGTLRKVVEEKFSGKNGLYG